MDDTRSSPSALNMDVLRNVLALSDGRTIARMMQLSRELYHEGPKHLLRLPVRLRRESSISSFVAFMLAEDARRVRFLTNLHISTGLLSRAEAGPFEDFVFRFAPQMNIIQLDIERAEEFFESSPGLSSAFSLLTTVKHLKMDEIGRRASIFLEQLRSQLVSADLTMIPRPIRHDEDDEDSDEDEDEDDPSIRNPILQLRNSQDTLKSLDVTFGDTDCDVGELFEQRYPHVKRLNLIANELPYTMHYARAYPNVTTLTIACAERELAELGTKMDDYVDQRHVNKLEQMSHGSWKSLKEVHGTLIDHFLLAALCPVEQLHIRGPFMDTRMFRSVLLTTTPAYVNFDAFDVDLFYEADFKRLMRGHFVQPIRCFEITLMLGGILEPKDVSMPRALDILLEGISQMPSLRSFGLTLMCFSLVPELEDYLLGVTGSGSVPLTRAEKYLQDIDLNGLVGRIREAVPTLESVVVTLFGHRTRANTSATFGADVPWPKGAVEAIPLERAPTITRISKSMVHTIANMVL
ncbi:hypothetical protein BV20DRAFT_954278 [Pilatotrama ljubarskyi]|nr:hypothetical protein BV20DRAFT_954278 [Pilatotrama ljubarskyi]